MTKGAKLSLAAMVLVLLVGIVIVSIVKAKPVGVQALETEPLTSVLKDEEGRRKRDSKLALKKDVSRRLRLMHNRRVFGDRVMSLTLLTTTVPPFLL